MSTGSSITYAQLATLYEVSRKINSQLDFEKLLDEIMDLAIELLHAEKGLILFKDEASGELNVEVARHMDRRSIENVVALSWSVIRKVESEGKSVLLQRVPDVPAGKVTRSLTRYKIKSVVCVPLRCHDRFLGTIYLDTTDAKHFFKPEDVTFLEGFANLAAIAIENARAYEAIRQLNENLERKVELRTRELREAQAQLVHSEKMASLGMLVAGVAHEINTPMGAITSNTDTLERSLEKLRALTERCRCGLGEDMQRLADTMQCLTEVSETACRRVNQIVRSLRTFARLDEGEIKSVDLHESLDCTLDLIQHLSRDRIECVKEYGDLPPVPCYANELNQVLMNLLVNACQAIPDTGRIFIRTFTEGQMACIQIQDTGVGIAPENLQKIFDPGFTTKGVGVGTGLGLSISFNIIQKHNGRIEVESQVGKGTTFTVRLPLSPASQR